ncbi:structure-specific endonuclease subunit slx1-like [Tubulanus polymorphus]|uniref:structure-specific endonuclease subunit slx1-like n=1 Tax=Tubulanus polymorphus TaxID=672921 RepID=UPI003DA1FEB6
MMSNDSEIEDFYGCYLLYCTNPKYKGHTYIGYTVNPNRRIQQHNKGVKAGGAKRTSSKGPWDMVLIIHGFPNDVSALRFEWAWQNPLKSRRLKILPTISKKKKESRFEYRFRVACNMLRTAPWNRLPLTFRWLKPEYKIEFNPLCAPPYHMALAYGLVKTKKVDKPVDEDETARVLMRCKICKRKIKHDDGLKCIHFNCSMHAHIACLAKHFLGDSQHIIPLNGECPTCRKTMLWGDLIRYKKGCYQNLQEVEEDAEHWTDNLNI